MNSATVSDMNSVVTLEVATFRVGTLLLGLPIESVQEINRNVDATYIPHAAKEILGVFNLRGEVTTVIDLRRVLGLPEAALTATSRNLIVRAPEESVGLLVDSVADIIRIDKQSVVPTPANVSGADGRFFKGVHHTPTDIVVLLDVDAVLKHDSDTVSNAVDGIVSSA